MKYLLLILTFFSLGFVKSFAQKDKSLPITINIKILKEYEVRLSKDYFTYSQIDRGSYNITTDSVTQKQYDIEIKLTNNSKQPIYIWLMTCSWENNFRINNNYIYFGTLGCDRNKPELINLNPKSSKLYQTKLVKSIKFENPCENCIYGNQVETTKLGLILIDDIYKPKLDRFFGYHLAMEDESIWKIVWSNPLYLLIEDEANPKPKVLHTTAPTRK